MPEPPAPPLEARGSTAEELLARVAPLLARVAPPSRNTLSPQELARWLVDKRLAVDEGGMLIATERGRELGRALV